MFRSIALCAVLALAACGSRASSGPAWPKSQEPEKDGGESLAPHESVATAASETDDDDEDEDVAEPTPEPAAKADKPETPAVTPPTTPDLPTDLPVTTEEIIIEVED